MTEPEKEAGGPAVCEELSERLGLHVFADSDEDALLGAARPF